MYSLNTCCIIDKEIDDLITEQLKRFENLKQKLEEGPELQKQMTNNLISLEDKVA